MPTTGSPLMNRHNTSISSNALMINYELLASKEQTDEIRDEKKLKMISTVNQFVKFGKAKGYCHEEPVFTHQKRSKVDQMD